MIRISIDTIAPPIREFKNRIIDIHVDTIIILTTTTIFIHIGLPMHYVKLDKAVETIKYPSKQNKTHVCVLQFDVSSWVIDIAYRNVPALSFHSSISPLLVLVRSYVRRFRCISHQTTQCDVFIIDGSIHHSWSLLSSLSSLIVSVYFRTNRSSDWLQS